MGFFGDIAAVQVSSMLFYAAYGVSISIILKNVGAIARTLINTIAICFTALLDVAFFGESISVLEGTTFAIIFKDYRPNCAAEESIQATKVPLIS